MASLLTGRNRRDFWVLTFGQGLMFCSYYTFFQFPLFIQALGGRERAIGIVMGSSALAYTGLIPWIAEYVNRLERRRLMLAGAGFLALSTLACLSLAAVNAWMVTLMVLRGMGFGLYANASGAYAAQIMPAAERGRWIGVNFAANQIAIAIAPALAEQTILHLGFRAFLLLSVAFSAAGMALVWQVSLQRPAAASGVGNPLWVLAGFARFLVSPACRWIFLTLLMMGCALGAVFTFTATYVRGLGLASGLFFAVYASVNALTRILAGGTSDRLGRAVVIIPALCTFAGGLALYGGAQGLGLVLTAGLTIGLGFGLANPAVLAQLLDRTPRESHARAIAAFNLAFQLGTLGASPLLGLVALHWGYPPMWRLAGAAGLAGAFIYWMKCARVEQRSGVPAREQ